MMLERRGKGRGADRHAPILAKLAVLSQLVELMLQPVRDRRPAQEGEHLLRSLPEAITEKQQVEL